MQFEVGKKYRTGSGDNIWTCIGITSVNGDEVPILLHKDGTNVYPLNAVFWNSRFWAEHREPVAVEGWVNVYDTPFASQAVFSSKEDAIGTAKLLISNTHRKLVATVYVKGTSDAP